MEFRNNFNEENKRKDDAVLQQRTSKTAGRVVCLSSIILSDGMIFDPVTGSFGGNC